VVRAERERESSEGQSRGMPRKDARFARTLLEEEVERQVCWPTEQPGRGAGNEQIGTAARSPAEGVAFRVGDQEGFEFWLLGTPLPHL